MDIALQGALEGKDVIGWGMTDVFVLLAARFLPGAAGALRLVTFVACCF